MKKLILALVCATTLTGLSTDVRASGGSGGSETIKVSKCYSTFTSYCELLIKASSTDKNAHLFAFIPSGQCIGEVQNGSGGRYGGSVFLTAVPPDTITIISSSGASITVVPTPFQP